MKYTTPLLTGTLICAELLNSGCGYFKGDTDILHVSKGNFSVSARYQSSDAIEPRSITGAYNVEIADRRRSQRLEPLWFDREYTLEFAGNREAQKFFPEEISARDIAANGTIDSITTSDCTWDRYSSDNTCSEAQRKGASELLEYALRSVKK